MLSTAPPRLVPRNACIAVIRVLDRKRYIPTISGKEHELNTRKIVQIAELLSNIRSNRVIYTVFFVVYKSSENPGYISWSASNPNDDCFNNTEVYCRIPTPWPLP